MNFFSRHTNRELQMSVRERRTCFALQQALNVTSRIIGAITGGKTWTRTLACSTWCLAVLIGFAVPSAKACDRHFYNNSLYTYHIASDAIAGPDGLPASDLVVPPSTTVELHYGSRGVWQGYLDIKSDIPLMGGLGPGHQRWKIESGEFSRCLYIDHHNDGGLENAIYFNDPADGDIATCESLCIPIVKQSDAEKFAYPQCKPLPPAPFTGAVLFGMGRDDVLYRKSAGLDGPWTAVPGYTSRRPLQSVASLPDGTLLGLDANGKVYELPPPYNADWQVSTRIPAAGNLVSIMTLSDGTLFGGSIHGMMKFTGRIWAETASASQMWPYDALGIMPNGRFLVHGKNGMFDEYKIDDQEFIKIAPPDTLYYPKKLTEQLFSEKADSFTFLPSGMLVFSTQVGSDRLITWYVDNCLVPAQGVVSNEGAPPRRAQDISAATRQWKALTVVKAQ